MLEINVNICLNLINKMMWTIDSKIPKKYLKAIFYKG